MMEKLSPVICLKIIIMSNPNYKGVPRVVFTIPPLASIGLQEEVAREQGLHFKTKKADTSSWYSRRIGEKYSGFKMLIAEGTDRILGARRSY
jgi:glutathione reductase (NADPH)